MPLLLIELNYRFISFKNCLSELEPSGMDFDKLQAFDNIDYLMNMYRSNDIGLRITDSMVSSNKDLITTMKITRITELCVYCVLGLIASYLISTLKKSTTEQVNQTLFLYTRLNKKTLKGTKLGCRLTYSVSKKA